MNKKISQKNIISFIKQNIILLISSLYLIVNTIYIFKYSTVKVNSIHYTNTLYFFTFIIVPGLLSFFLTLFSLKTINRYKLNKYRNTYNIITLILCPISIFLFLLINIDIPHTRITPYISQFLMTFSVKYTLIPLALINLFYELMRNIPLKTINLPHISYKKSLFIKFLLILIIFFTIISGYIHTSVTMLLLLSLYLFAYNEKNERLSPEIIVLYSLLILIFLPLELSYFINTDILYKFIFI